METLRVTEKYNANTTHRKIYYLSILYQKDNICLHFKIRFNMELYGILDSNARIIWLNFKSIRFKLIKFNKNITTTKSVNFIINIYY